MAEIGKAALPPGEMIRRFHSAHVTRYVLCNDDGREVRDIHEEDVMGVAHCCARDGRGYVKQVHIPLEEMRLGERS